MSGVTGAVFSAVDRSSIPARPGRWSGPSPLSQAVLATADGGGAIRVDVETKKRAYAIAIAIRAAAKRRGLRVVSRYVTRDQALFLYCERIAS